MKTGKLVAYLNDKTKHVINIRNLKQTLNHGLLMKKCIESYNKTFVFENLLAQEMRKTQVLVKFQST